LLRGLVQPATGSENKIADLARHQQIGDIDNPEAARAVWHRILLV